MATKRADKFDGWLADTAEAIVSAGLDPRRWDAVPAKFTEAFPASKVIFYAQDLVAGFMGGYHANVAQAFIDSYRDYYCRHNPWSPFMARVPARVVLVADDAAPAASFAKTEFYNDWVRHVGESAAAIKLVDDDSRFTSLTIHYGAAVAENYNRSIATALRILEPTFHAAVSLNREVARAKAADSALATALNALSLPALIVDRLRAVRYANMQAVTALGAGALIRADRAGRLSLIDPLADARFRDILLRLCRDGETANADLQLAGPTGTVDGILSMFPIRDPPTDQGSLNWLFAPEPLALVMLRVTAARPVVPAEVLCRSFGLTGAEANLAVRLATGERLDQAANALGITRETARNQLKSVFAKTGTHRQAELVALLARL